MPRLLSAKISQGTHLQLRIAAVVLLLHLNPNLLVVLQELPPLRQRKPHVHRIITLHTNQNHKAKKPPCNVFYITAEYIKQVRTTLQTLNTQQKISNMIAMFSSSKDSTEHREI